MEFLAKLFSSDFIPHGHCYLWQSQIVWLHVISDGLIALAYYSIPAVLIYFALKRPDIEFNWMFLMFGAFILACGTTHVMSIWTIWVPMYRLDGVIKLITAALSVGTAILLFPIIPKALARPSPAQLAAANWALQQEIEERQRAEEKVQRLNAELERRVKDRTAELVRSNEELQKFAYVASHDLKEPLRMIASYSQLVARRYRGKLDQEADDFIGYTVEGAVRMQELLDGLLSYSRVETQGGRFVDADCGTIVRRAADNLQIAIAESGTRLNCGDLPRTVGDETQLTQLFQNLIGNAIKFRKNGAPVIDIEATRDGGAWIISVADNGIGIDPRHAERVFVMYQRLHTREEYPGTGIGLTICKKIVERHGGRIWVTPRHGGGSVFSFTLPDNHGGIDVGGATSREAGGHPAGGGQHC